MDSWCGIGCHNGCSGILGNNLGQQYGGLLSDWKNQVGWWIYDDEMYIKRKE